MKRRFYAHNQRRILACAFVLILMATELAPAVENGVTLGKVEAIRPPSNADPYANEKKTLWQVITVRAEKSLIKRAYDQHLTLAFDFDDCGGKLLFQSDPYLGNISLYQMKLTAKEFAELYAGLPAAVNIDAYVELSKYKATERLCMRLSGGNMLGQSETSEHVVVK